MSLNPSNCPTSCLDPVPVVEFDDCAPEVNYGQIEFLYLTGPTNIFLDWTSGVEWAAKIDNSGNSSSDIRQLRGIFQKPAAADNEVIIDGGRRIPGPKEHTITGRIYETNATNYDFLRTLECSPGTKLLWYETRAAGDDSLRKLYGGNVGIKAFVKIKEVIPEAENEASYFEVEIKWIAKFHPERTNSPITH